MRETCGGGGRRNTEGGGGKGGEEVWPGVVTEADGRGGELLLFLVLVARKKDKSGRSGVVAEYLYNASKKVNP